ncbi:glycosyltransferase [Brachybacterium sp. YJGR34]|uniref:glycosyltransferase n=1 Tax=Brachybacterium sp. YJGR34 TaxID=2059911 RepID=UPI001300AA9C|nr:glycosyltransferase [Brachybacterium sp. YJGR34]
MQAVRTGTAAPSAPRAEDGQAPGAHRTELLLQSSRLGPAVPVWDQVLPLATWRPVLRDSPVHLVLEGGRGVLWGARAGRTVRLAELPAGRHALEGDALAQDWLWLTGAAHAVRWSTERDAPLPPVTVVMPTYRREADATAQARRFARMRPVRGVVVVDQGGTLAGNAAFTRLRAEHEGIRLVTQENLGGSGGYARGMLEAAEDPRAAVLFSDDDAILGEESLRRMLTYQALAARPTIVGSPLFSSAEPTRLVALAEAVRPGSFQWRSATRVQDGIDLAGTTPADWDDLMPRRDANYTGWWASLFPPHAFTDLGLPAPLFLKWDDAEYGLRATRRGYDHAVLPGTSVHHPPWTPFRTQTTWTARVLHRNRLAIAAAYGAGRGVLVSSLAHQLKHVLAGHLLTAELWEEGIDAFRAGPEDWLGRDLARARSDGARAVAAGRAATAPTVELTATRRRPLPLPRALARAAARLLRPDTAPRIVVALPADSLHWRTTLGADAYLLTGADGETLSAVEVRGSVARHALARTLRSHLSMAVRWSSLRRSYRRALPRHTTTESWQKVFASSPGARPTGGA